MSYLINNQQKINEIIFRGRNKSYGAYAIRSSYGNTVFKSLAFMFVGFSSLMTIAFYMSNRPEGQNLNIGQVFEKDSVYIVPMDLTKEEQRPRVSEPAKASSGAVSRGIGTVVSDTTLAEKTATAQVLASSTASATGVGEGTTTVVSSGSVVVSNTETIVDADPVPIPDSAPEFEGGLKALYTFLSSKLKYPGEAQDAGKEGTVYVKFVVDQHGKVGNLKLLNNLGYGLDEEALRVVSIIPNFKTPGKVNGRAVKVYYQLPIKFKMN